MNEAETRTEYIDPKLMVSGWGVMDDSKVLREHPSFLSRRLILIPIRLKPRFLHSGRRFPKGRSWLMKEFDDQITALKKDARTAVNLPEKLTVQKKIRDLDAKRNAAWKEYDEAAKVTEEQKDGLLDTVEKQLKQRVEKKTLFVIKWKII